MVALNHAVALAMADGPQLGLARLQEITGLDRYHLFHAARGELLLTAGDPAAAVAAFVRARALAQQPGRAATPRPAARERAADHYAGDMTTQNFDDDAPVEDTAGDVTEPGEYGSLSVEDDPAGTTDPAELAGTADESDEDVELPSQCAP